MRIKQFCDLNSIKNSFDVLFKMFCFLVRLTQIKVIFQNHITVELKAQKLYNVNFIINFQ